MYTSLSKTAILAIGVSLLFASCDRHHKSGNPEKDILIENRDTTVRPGDDFFSYANGAWIKKNPIPGAYSSWGIGNLVVEDVRNKLKEINEQALKANAKEGSNMQKIGDFYFSGMDTVGIEKAGLSALKAELDGINAAKDLPGFLKIVSNLRLKGVNALFYAGVSQDAMKSEEMAMQFYQGGLGLPNREYYLNTDERTTKIREDYKNVFLPTIFELSGSDKATAKKQAEKVFAMEKEMAEHSRKLEDLRDPYANYHKMSVADFSKSTPNIVWENVLTQMGVPPVDSVIIGQPEFFTHLSSILTKYSIDDWKTYLKFNLINTYAEFLNASIQQENFRFYDGVISGKKEQLPRWKRVLDAEEAVMGELLGQLFVKDYFNETAKKRYEQMVDNVIAAYRERIQKLDWMSAATKEKALLKLSTITKKVGYPDKWKDYSDLKIVRNSYVANIIAANEWYNHRQIAKLGKPVDRTEWDMTPQTYNAYYNPSNNEIVLPAGIFIIPGMRDEDIDDAVVYGYGGASTIGHEITHGFDDEGRQFDEKGNLKSWWTKEDEEKFKARAQVMIDEFDSFVVLDSLHVNGKATLGENIADLGGIVLAMDAFKKTDQYKKGESINGLTPSQRYYMGYALGWLGHQRDERLANQILTDVHSPGNLRVNGPFANLPEFYEAFGIKEGDAMWRPEAKRVKIW